MTPLQNLPRNVGDLGILIYAKGFKKLPKVQKITKSGHTGQNKGKVNCASLVCLSVDFIKLLIRATLCISGHRLFYMAHTEQTSSTSFSVVEDTTMEVTNNQCDQIGISWQQILLQK